MENTPLDQEEKNAPEPTPTAPAPASPKLGPETWQQENPEVMFLLGLGLGLLSTLLAQAITLPTNGRVPGCVLPALGLPYACLLFAFKPKRFLAFGLVMGLLFAGLISAALLFRVVCGPGPGC